MIDRAAILAKYRAGEKVSAIAAEHHCSLNTVCNIARAAGVARRARPEPSARDREICSAFAADASATEISRVYGISRVRVYQIAEMFGLPRRKRGRRPAQ